MSYTPTLSKEKTNLSQQRTTKAGSTLVQNSAGDVNKLNYSGDINKFNHSSDVNKFKPSLAKIPSTRKPDEKNTDEDMFRRKEIIQERRFTERSHIVHDATRFNKSFSGRHSNVRIESLNLSNFERPKNQCSKTFRIFVGTWNVGGKTPSNNLNLGSFLRPDISPDIYILGFQEIVPLNASNVLVIEDNEPAAKWLTLINEALNKSLQDSVCKDDFTDHNSSKQQNQKDSKSNPQKDSKLIPQKDSKSNSGLFFQKPSLKVLSKNYRANCSALKTCNCPQEMSPRRRKAKEMRDLIDRVNTNIEDELSELSSPQNNLNYYLISSKQMVGIFLTVWIKRELVQHVGHLRTCSVGRGIMNCLGNKGCIAISLSLHQTSFCFVCCHLTSGEKDGDEFKRNSDVAEILKSTQFAKICKSRMYRVPEKILEHDRVIWLGDLNYRCSISYDDAQILLHDKDWKTLLNKDQLSNEKEAGRVFQGWNEGRIYFAPTYKYIPNSDNYIGENTKSKKKRRTPAWCDRILWYGKGMEQLSYTRGESRISDHRPVFALFNAQVESINQKCRKGYSSVGARVAQADSTPQRHSFYEY